MDDICEWSEVPEGLEFEKIDKRLSKHKLKIEDFISSGETNFSIEHKKEKSEISSLQETLNWIKRNGKHGLSIQRYKGLGEMNPQQLWETTMDPETRTVLRVTLDDVIEADEMFTVLMGDSVESRREFIQKNARAVRNLDV